MGLLQTSLKPQLHSLHSVKQFPLEIGEFFSHCINNLMEVLIMATSILFMGLQIILILMIAMVLIAFIGAIIGAFTDDTDKPTYNHKDDEDWMQ